MLPSMLKKKLESVSSTMVKTLQDEPANKRKFNENGSSVNGKKVKLSKSYLKKQNSTYNNGQSIETTDETINALQTNEIYNEINNNTNWLNGNDLELWKNEFLEHITNLPEDKQKQYTTLKWIDKEIVIPMKKKHLDNIPNYSTIKFIPPKQIHLIGSLNLETMVLNNNVGGKDSSDDCSNLRPIIDLCIVMPPAYFSKDDYLNMIYFTKKSLFLSYLTMKLKLWQRKSEAYFFRFYDNNELCPMLEIETIISKTPVIVRIRLSSEPNTFKQNKLLPNSVNINGNIFNGNDDDEEINKVASAHYNNMIIGDLMMVSNEIILKKILENQLTIKKAIVLFKKWLYTVGIYSENLNGYIISMYVAYLLKKKKLQLSMTVLEVLKVLWTNLATTNWNLPNGGISLCDTKMTDKLEIFHQYFNVVFLDFQGNYNLCGNLSLDLYLRLKYECNQTLKYFKYNTVTTFRRLFLSDIPNYLRYDHIFNIRIKGDLLMALKVSEFDQLFYDFCGQWYQGYIFSIAKVLRKGFGNRIHTMTPIPSSNNYKWSINKKYSTDKLNLTFGLILNDEYALEILDKGPQADQYEAIDFRKFWGSKSELRRFQDGTITESCVWEKLHSSMSEKRIICKKIALHLLNHHFGLAETDINYMADEFDSAYRVLDSVVDNKPSLENIPTNSESLSLAVIKSFDELGKQLRSLENFPLDISTILGTSPVFRYCEVNPILPQANVEIVDGFNIFHSYVINEGVIQFALSSKWPNDLAAIQRIKGAFYVKIVKSLREQFKLSTRYNGNGIEVIKDGYMFRLKIVTAKELMIMKKTKTSKGVTKYVDTEDSLKFHMNMILLPKLTSNLHALYHEHSSFGPAVLIAKRWLSAQLIDCTLWPEECTEIIMAYIYKQNNFLNIPIQPQVAFYRFLHILALTNWHQEMIFINFDDNLPENELENLEKRFDSQRQLFPQVCICTMFENKELSIWSKSNPTIEMVTRASILSNYMINTLENDIATNNHINHNIFFSPSMDGYDLMIKLKTTKVQSCNLYDFTKDIGKNKFIDESAPAADFNLAQIFLKDLRTNYQDFAIFFYDSYGGDIITVLWKPIVYSATDFTGFQISGRKSVSNSSTRTIKYKCNVKQLIEDFLILGNGIILSITEMVK